MKSTSVMLLLSLVVRIALTHVEGRVRSIGGADFCVKRHDGPYTVGCIQQFVTCSNKISHVMSCRDRHFFDKRTNKCVPKWYASSCHGYGYQRPSHAFVPVFTPTEPLDSSFCDQRQNGDYNIGCVSAYISCVGRHAHARECAGSLVLDELSDMCVDKIYVGVCGGNPTTTVAVEIPAIAAAPVVTSPPVVASPPAVTSYPVVAPPPPVGHPPVVASPPAVENPPMIATPPAAEYPPVVATPPAAEYPPVVASPAIADTSPVEVAAEAIVMLPTVKHCRHRNNGFFGLGCSSLYFACINGQPVYKTCPRDFTFHEKRLICVAKCEVRGCDCLSTMMPPPITAATPTPEATIVVPTTRSEVRPCIPHKSGFFALGCSSRYLVCVNGRPTYSSCKYGVFDERKRICLPRHMVKRCWRPIFDVGEAY